jgi:hypothetical protein
MDMDGKKEEEWNRNKFSWVVIRKGRNRVYVIKMLMFKYNEFYIIGVVI